MWSLNMHAASLVFHLGTGSRSLVFHSPQSARYCPGNNIGVPRFQSSPFVPPLPGRQDWQQNDALGRAFFAFSPRGNGQGTLFLPQGPMGDLIPKLPNCLGLAAAGVAGAPLVGPPFPYS